MQLICNISTQPGERPGLHDQSGSNISTQSGERPGLQGQSGSNRMSESTVTLIIVVTVCSVVGVVLIIIAVACIVTCAKKRKKNKGVVSSVYFIQIHCNHKGFADITKSLKPMLPYDANAWRILTTDIELIEWLYSDIIMKIRVLHQSLLLIYV